MSNIKKFINDQETNQFKRFNSTSVVPNKHYTAEEGLGKIMTQIDDIQDVLTNLRKQELIVKNKNEKVSLVIKDMIKYQISIRDKAELISGFLEKEESLMRDKTRRYDDKTSRVCKRVLSDLKDIILTNNRTLGLYRDLISEI